MFNPLLSKFLFFYSTQISIFIPCFLFLSKPQGKKLDRSYEMKKVVRQVIKGLERAGLVYFKDSRTDLYEVINLTINKPVSPTVHSGSSKKWIFSFFFFLSSCISSLWFCRYYFSTPHKTSIIHMNSYLCSMCFLLISLDWRLGFQFKGWFCSFLLISTCLSVSVFANLHQQLFLKNISRLIF